MKVKICGVRTEAAAAVIEHAGAELAGINFASFSRRRVDLAAAKRIAARFSRTTPVGVFADQGPEEIDGIAREVGLDWVQLHGRESAEVSAALSRRYRVIKAFSVDEAFDPTLLQAHVRWVEMFLFDAPKPGSGQVFDWSAVPTSPRPFLLAGGLTKENVRGAIAAVAPFGVDTASGVEVGGVQDADAIRAFVRAARGE